MQVWAGSAPPFCPIAGCSCHPALQAAWFAGVVNVRGVSDWGTGSK